ncbi:hypothetical protein ES703_117299 [subsurface metagenome]
MSGLKADPGWRLDWVVLSNWLTLKSLPPTIAFISPAPGVMLKMAPWASGICSNETSQTRPGLSSVAVAAEGSLISLSMRTRITSPCFST